MNLFKLYDFKNNSKSLLLNLRGWKTNKKIIVIESDDWGSVRMPSTEVYNKCLNNGYRVDLNPYERYDSLASSDDLELLFAVLYKFRDVNDNHPVITANCVTSNPDFEKIRESRNHEYTNESIIETFRKYPKHSGNFELWLDAMKSGVFFPQYHAREHLNVSLFINAIKSGDKDILFAIENNMPGIIPYGELGGGNKYVTATKFNSEVDKKEKLEIYLDGLTHFERLFGYKSLTVIPTNYYWSNDFNKAIAEYGVRAIQGIRIMREPVSGSKPILQKRTPGSKNEFNQVALVRNCSFEPTLNSIDKTIDKCLGEIDMAFKMKKPAIISSHRVNFVGFLVEKNRDENLNLLNSLLLSILKRWPDVEFMSSEALANFIIEDKKIYNYESCNT